MIDVSKALADLRAAPGDIVAVPKVQMEHLLTELAARQVRLPPSDISFFAVRAMPA